MSFIQIEIVSAEALVFNGKAKFVTLPAEMGELGVFPGHTPLLARISPGIVQIQLPNDGQESIFVAGGILEIQPQKITVLADTAIREKDLDEAQIQKKKNIAEADLAQKSSTVNLAQARTELALATAQLAALTLLRKKK